VADKNHRCQLVTNKLTLTLSEQGSDALIGALEPPHGCQKPECLLIIPLGVVAASATSIIVSGSIVVVGNTIHWVEKQGRCENSVTQTVVRGLVDSIKAIGGKTIQSTTDLITWFKELFSD
jgi:hypothetical protein